MNHQIFKDIADLITQSDFISTQSDFISKNNHVFEETEENKLEYTQIYSDYVYILE